MHHVIYIYETKQQIDYSYMVANLDDEEEKKIICKIWYKNNREHRINKPAIERDNGEEEWYVEGKRHRIGGPAIVLQTEEFYYVDGYKYDFTVEYGTKTWQINHVFQKKLHSFYDTPAIEYANGDKEWWFMGKRHRENGPAVIYGNKHYYFKNGYFIKEEIKCTL